MSIIANSNGSSSHPEEARPVTEEDLERLLEVIPLITGDTRRALKKLKEGAGRYAAAINRWIEEHPDLADLPVRELLGADGPSRLRLVGDDEDPEGAARLAESAGELIDECDEFLHPDAPPKPEYVWRGVHQEVRSVLEVDGVPLLIAGQSHMISAQPAMGKTMMALILAKEVVGKGGRVLMVNAGGESSGEDIDQRLLALGLAPPISPEDCDDHYRELDSLKHAPGAAWWWVAEGDAPGLIIVDTVTSAGGSQEADAYTKWWDTAIRPTVNAMNDNGALVLIDHKPKRKPENEPNHTRGGIGTQDKLGRLTGAAYALDWDKNMPVSALAEARGTLTVEKYRGSAMRLGDKFTVDTWPDPDGGLAYRLAKADTGGAAKEAGGVTPELLDKAEGVIEENPGASKRTIRDGLGVRTVLVDKVVKALEQEGRIRITKVGQKHEHHVVDRLLPPE